MTTAFQVNAFQNDAFQIVITPTSNRGLGGDDAWTPEERKRYKALQKKLRIAEEKRIIAEKESKESRKQVIADLVDPPKVSKRKQNKVELKQELSVDTPSQLAAIDRYIANLEKQRQNLFDAVQLRQAKALLEQELVALEAKRQAELDDEEAILLLL